MSLASACLWTLARTLVICLVAWPVCAVVERWLRGLSDSRRSVALIGLLAPFCFPELLVGYAFRDLALAHPRWAELLCSGLLFVRVVPVGAVALLMAPPGDLDAAALHCRRLLVRSRGRSPREWIELARCHWHGPITRALPALGLMAVVSFQEFELAALLMTISWTDWFVAAERVGLERGEMLRQAAWPLLMQLPVLLGIIGWLGLVGRTPRPSEIVGTRTDEAFLLRGVWRVVPWLAMVYVGLAVVAGCVAPLSLIGWRTLDGLWLLLEHRSQQMGLAREMAISTSVALCAGLTAWAICRGLGRIGLRSRVFKLSSLAIQPQRGGVKPAQGNALGVIDNREFQALKGRQSSCEQYPPPLQGLERDNDHHPGRRSRWSLALGWLNTAPLGLKTRIAQLLNSRVALSGGVCLLLPGLLGSLLLSLGTVALFQVSWLRPLYDTPVPWVLALTAWLLPRAAVLQLWLDATRPSEAVHLADLAMSNEQRATRRRAGSVSRSPQHSLLIALLWRLRDQPTFLAISLLCYWAYCDLPTAYLLAPTGMASGLVRLYNFMHFGRSAALSAEACLFFGGPLLAAGLVLLIVRWWREDR